MSKAPRFITLEGGDGSGKSTQIRRLAAELKKRKIDAIVTREPGGSPGAEDIRNLVLNGDPERWDSLTEALLMFAARANHVSHTIKPALMKRQWVICDRFTDSTYAYQGAGHGLARETIRRMEALVLGDFRPDLTLILDIPVEQGLARTSGRTKDMRFEAFDHDFHERMRQCYLTIARKDPMRCEVIDASQDEDAVAKAIWAAVKKRYKL
ncbi:MAG: dTMP kinase [Alphaproteobacteria bacterium]|nr:dTMP kinase [Alphaproteobacteria bacterium]MBL7098482.1 dTMP kinase [Alphaproteobacteria bacterium]